MFCERMDCVSLLMIPQSCEWKKEGMLISVISTSRKLPITDCDGVTK